MAKPLLITVCGRAGSKGFKNKNLKTFCGHPLVYYTLSAIELFLAAQPGLEADVVLSTDSDELRRLVCGGYPWVVPLQRPPHLAGDAVAKLEVFKHCLHEMEEKQGAPYQYLLDLDITSPLRTAEDVAGCLAALWARPDLELVMSAVKSRRSPYMNMAVREGETVRQVVPTAFVARQQAPQCYDLNASIYAFRRNFLAHNQSGRIWDAACDIYEMADTAVLDIDSEEDFEWMETIAQRLYATRPAFAAVRNNIKSGQ
ncbi:MAG: acylneuraminate cytidylyltransferase family protein [Oscillospiraceae bacterium]